MQIQGPMLCSQHKRSQSDPRAAVAALQATGRYAFEVKWDGVRGLAVWDPTFRLVNRRHLVITETYPDLVQVLGGTRPGATVLDGEIVVLNGDGSANFEATHHRNAQGTPLAARFLAMRFPAIFVAFDALFIDGTDLRDHSYLARRSRLEQFVAEGPYGEQLQLVQSTPNGVGLWDRVVREGHEGVVAKVIGSIYTPGMRSHQWIKIRRTRSLTAMVYDYEPGAGRRADTFGALRLALLDPTAEAGSNLVKIGKVGSGFTDKDLKEIRRRIDDQTVILVEVKYHEFLQGSLRFPCFMRLRDDQSVLDCLITQLE